MKPMLAAKTDMTKIQYPCAASPKLDGVRAVVRGGVVLSRTGKPIPNKHVQSLFGNTVYEGFDGELIVGQPTDKGVFSATTSGVMSVEGEPNVSYWVFDLFDCDQTPFIERHRHLAMIVDRYPLHVCVVPHNLIENAEVLEVYEREVLRMGYEGVMVRDIRGSYKHGRSTANEFGLMKIKRFQDGEAKITGLEEMHHNDNELKYNAIGHIDRSLSKEGMIPAGIMGALVVRDLVTEKEFRIGTGFNSLARLEFWEHKKELIGKVVKYKYLEYGAKDLPRHPVFLGFRDESDIS